MNKTLATAQKTKYTRNTSKHRTVQPNEYSRSHYIEKAPSLIALKILQLFISHAANQMSDDIEHTIPWEDITNYLKKKKLSQTSIKKYYNELVGTLVIYEGKDSWGSSTILSKCYTYLNSRTSNQIQIKYKFGQGFRDAAKESNGYTMLDIPYMMNFELKYSIPIYELIASYINIPRLKHKTFEIEHFKKLIGVNPKSTWSNGNFITRCVNPSLEEIAKIPYIEINTHLTKKGQKYTHITFYFDTHYKRRKNKKDHMGNPIGTVNI